MPLTDTSHNSMIRASFLAAIPDHFRTVLSADSSVDAFVRTSHHSAEYGTALIVVGYAQPGPFGGMSTSFAATNIESTVAPAKTPLLGYFGTSLVTAALSIRSSCSVPLADASIDDLERASLDFAVFFGVTFVASAKSCMEYFI
mmetsp:Transcript_1260/g.1932  ORF Transcript_1260/g.1932 Transcript_1260/m.1932 type:complete len:144 (-) Transcript_1260:60-491(-)